MPHHALYLDEPFALSRGGDKNRSRFLWDILSREHQADWVEVQSSDPGGQNSGPIRPVLRLAARRAHPWTSQSIHHFGKAERDQFRALLREKRPRFIFARFHSAWELLQIADEPAARVPVVIDVDMLSSRLAELAWNRNRSWRNRYFLFETWKLRALETRLFRRPFLFLLTNGAELSAAGLDGGLIDGAGKAIVVPNFMPPVPASPDAAPEKPVILFYGSLDSTANTDAVLFLVREILPRIESALKQHNLEVHLVGKNPSPLVQDLVRQSGNNRLRLVGEVNSVEKAIQEARLVLLPIRVASGTRTRILEAGAVGKAVVTTSLGAEGLDLTPEAVCIQDSAEGLARAVTRLLEQPSLAREMGRQLQKQCLALYDPRGIATSFGLELDAFLSRWRAKFGSSPQQTQV